MPPKYRYRGPPLPAILADKRGMQKGYKCRNWKTVKPKKRFKQAFVQRCAKYKGTRGPYTNKTNKQCLFLNDKTPNRCAKYFNFD